MSIKIKDVVAITGVGGLFHVIKSDERAIVIESMDERKKRKLVKGDMMVSKLADISIYTEEESTSLAEIFRTIKEKYQDDVPVTKKSSKDELMGFLEEILPDYDKERVYPSNVKKLVSWYGLLMKNDVDLAVEEKEDDSSMTDEEKEKKAKKEKKTKDIKAQKSEQGKKGSAKSKSKKKSKK